MKTEYYLPLGSDYLHRQSATFLFSETTNTAIERMRYDKSIYAIEYCGFFNLHLEKS